MSPLFESVFGVAVEAGGATTGLAGASAVVLNSLGSLSLGLGLSASLTTHAQLVQQAH